MDKKVRIMGIDLKFATGFYKQRDKYTGSLIDVPYNSENSFWGIISQGWYGCKANRGNQIRLDGLLMGIEMVISEFLWMRINIFYSILNTWKVSYICLSIVIHPQIITVDGLTQHQS